MRMNKKKKVGKEISMIFEATEDKEQKIIKQMSAPLYNARIKLQKNQIKNKINEFLKMEMDQDTLTLRKKRKTVL